MADKEAAESQDALAGLFSADETSRRRDPDRMPVDLQKVILAIPGLELSDLIAFAEWQQPRRNSGK